MGDVGVGRGELRLQPAQRSGEATGRRWGGGRSPPQGGEVGRRRTRAPRLVTVTVTAGGAGTEGADSLGEMAGDGRRRVLGALHLLLLAALPLATEGISRGAAGWTQEKVRDCCCAMVPGRLLPGAGTWGRASPPRQRGRRGGAERRSRPQQPCRFGLPGERGLCVLARGPR